MVARRDWRVALSEKIVKTISKLQRCLVESRSLYVSVSKMKIDFKHRKVHKNLHDRKCKTDLAKRRTLENSNIFQNTSQSHHSIEKIVHKS